jgi:hypothetical protein
MQSLQGPAKSAKENRVRRPKRGQRRSAVWFQDKLVASKDKPRSSSYLETLRKTMADWLILKFSRIIELSGVRIISWRKYI